MKFNTFGRAATVRTSLLAGAAALALPAAAQAQDTDADFDDEGAGVEAPVNSNVIVVTATKREQTLQETPVAVSVTSAETIEQAQIRDVSDLATVVPSLQVSQNQSSFATSYSVRGFGTDGNNIGLEPSVAMFVDGVYRSRAVSQISDLPDIQRVEVLRGPQSTLFGKNASAGVISIVTKEPQFDFGGMVEASYGNYDATLLSGFVNAGSDVVAGRIAFEWRKRDGYVENLAATQDEELYAKDQLGVRGSLIHDHGAYTARGVNIPQGAANCLTLPYNIAAYHLDIKLALTNKVPVTPIRGAGQPQGAFVMERLIDRAAREMGISQVEIRRKNFIQPDAFPYQTPVALAYDSGNYEGTLAAALRDRHAV